MTAIVNGVEYQVTFTSEWHRPPLDGARSPNRIKQTMRCAIIRPSDGAAGRDGNVWRGVAQCSVADRFDYMRGCRLALWRAARELATQYGSLTITNVYRADFVRQIMPQLALERRAHAASHPRRFKGPSRAHLRRAFAGACEAMALIALVATCPWLADAIARDVASQ